MSGIVRSVNHDQCFGYLFSNRFGLRGGRLTGQLLLVNLIDIWYRGKIFSGNDESLSVAGDSNP